MSGQLDFLGAITVGDCLPTAIGIYAGIYAQLQARIAALLELRARIGLKFPTLAARIEVVAALLASLKAALALGMPGVDIQLSAIAKALAGLNADLAAIAGIQVALGTAGVYAYSYDGDVTSLGPAFQALGIPGTQPTDHCNALILAATAPAVWAAMGKVFIQ